jgi:hypothetical protein
MTFALGLASVFVLNGSLKISEEITVNLPKIESEFPIIVFPRRLKEMPYTGGSPCCDSNNYDNKWSNKSKKIQK